MMNKPFNKYIEESIKENWEHLALSDYNGPSFHYKDVARRIEKLHIIFEECGLKKGDKVAICGRNSANWGIVFLATLAYGAVAVPILHEFKADSIHHIVNHSDARILFAGDVVWEGLNENAMHHLEAIILIPDFSLLYAKSNNIRLAREKLNEMYGKKYPKYFRPEHVSYHEDKPDELAVISYTSGTTGFSKGVMLSYRSLRSNLLFAREVFPGMKPGDTLVSMLPMAHMYGLAFEFIFEMSVGVHVHFLTRLPSPKIILDAFAKIKPNLIITVPLIVEKIYKNKLIPVLEKPLVKLALKLPILDQKIKKKIATSLESAFGNEFFEIVVGGAAFNRDAEKFFKDIGFRYTVGYGMTECGPIISYADWREARLYSCGKVVSRMTIKIDSPDPENIDGEILTRGDNVMLGYYKNDEATKDIIDEDGWLHTGDIGVMDKDGYLYIRGRSKNMILGASGQNIYPEEIEDKINAAMYVAESLVVEDQGKLVALIYPDYTQTDADGLSKEGIEKVFEKIRIELNKELPQYSQLMAVRLYPEEFEKTPKRSIKRYLYQISE